MYCVCNHELRSSDSCCTIFDDLGGEADGIVLLRRKKREFNPAEGNIFAFSANICSWSGRCGTMVVVVSDTHDI